MSLSAPPKQPSSSQENSSLLQANNNTHENERVGEGEEIGMDKIEKVINWGMIACMVVVAVLSVFLGDSISTELDLILYITLGGVTICPIILIPIAVFPSFFNLIIYFLFFDCFKIRKVKQDINSGSEMFACNHSNGLVFLFLIGIIFFFFFLLVTKDICRSFKCKIHY